MATKKFNNNIEEQYPELIKVLKRIGEESAATYKRNLEEKKPYRAVASGKLFNSIDYRVDVDDNGVRLYFLAADYYIRVENGRAPYGNGVDTAPTIEGKKKFTVINSPFPKIDVIKRWIQDKRIPLKNGSTLDQAAYLISRSIAIKGIKPSPFLRNIKKGLSSWDDEIKQAIAKDLGLVVSKIKSQLKYIKGNSHIQFRTI